MAKVKDRPIRKNDKVVATVDLPRVPEGTVGKVKLVNGLFRPGSWLRYWVFFANGVDLGSIPAEKVVKLDDWEAFKAERERRAALGQTGPVTASGDGAKAADGPGDGGPAAEGAASRIPEHLLERTRNRRKALGLS